MNYRHRVSKYLERKEKNLYLKVYKKKNKWGNKILENQNTED